MFVRFKYTTSDGDNSVYEHDNAKSQADIDKNYSAKNTAAGGKKIGALGGKINVNNIFKNLLKRDIKIAKGIINPRTFRNLVKGHGAWDLKSLNSNTIYGVANAYDKKYGTNTNFEFKGGMYSADDIGNFHYGATGSATWFGSNYILLHEAGLAQIAAGTSKPEWQPFRTVIGGHGMLTKVYLPPYGDDPEDQSMIKKGINYQKESE